MTSSHPHQLHLSNHQITSPAVEHTHTRTICGTAIRNQWSDQKPSPSPLCSLVRLVPSWPCLASELQLVCRSWSGPRSQRLSQTAIFTISPRRWSSCGYPPHPHRYDEPPLRTWTQLNPSLQPQKFQLRFSPSLANKPKGPSDPTKPRKPADPFAYPPPSAGLFLADVGASHFLVLNKFAVVPEHFILATRDFRPQTHVLEPRDLEAALACIGAYRDQGDELFAFFNSGEHSGASQPHRHLQLLPVARMREDLEGHEPWTVLADNIQPQKLPFATFSERINLGMSGADLHDIYLRLYGQAHHAVVVAAHAGHGSRAAADIPADGEAKMSYNMAMTRDTLVVCPRLAEGASITGADGSSVGTLSLNGTVLAGTALVKNELEWEALRGDANGLLDVLKRIGLPTGGGS